MVFYVHISLEWPIVSSHSSKTASMPRNRMVTTVIGFKWHIQSILSDLTSHYEVQERLLGNIMHKVARERKRWFYLCPLHGVTGLMTHIILLRNIRVHKQPEHVPVMRTFLAVNFMSSPENTKYTTFHCLIRHRRPINQHFNSTHFCESYQPDKD